MSDTQTTRPNLNQETNEDPIIKIKKQIQSIVSKLMSNPEPALTEEETKLIETIGKYKVAKNSEELSANFDNVLETPQTTNPGS
jgi:hypothetical protein